MSYIKGKFKSFIFESDSGYKIGLFRVTESDDEEIEINKTITFTGYFAELNKDDTYVFQGKYTFHNRYGYQFQVSEYEKKEPEGRETILDFLTSSFVKGCGIKTAEKIFEKFGNDALAKIKENKDNLLLVSSITEKKATQIYNSIIKYYEVDDEIFYLKSLGFSIKETMNLINIYGESISSIVNDNVYLLRDLIDFKKLDQIFLTNNDSEDNRRVEACILETMKYLSFSNGDTYLDKVEIVTYLANAFKITVNINDHLNNLYLNQRIIIDNEDYYLIDDYLDELNNAEAISKLVAKKKIKISEFEKYLSDAETNLEIKYNEDQALAIKTALSNNISIITGGPGTGKTTIINGIINIYSKIHKLNFELLSNYILLLAPTGRASKRMSETTKLGASTIHRFLKWDKESNTFNVNEFNKLHYNLIIVDETSMIDNRLLSSLFKGIDINTQIIFVGDEYQLPSVGAGLILNDMINSEVISHTRLNSIYRQSENSFIPILAKEIKETNIISNILEKKDDYNFIETSNYDIKSVLNQILEKSCQKNLDETNIQVLAPMYKGENGIDNLNLLLQDFFNPEAKNKSEINYGGVIYREGDKILNLVNDIDSNISNGDIGYIIEINLEAKNAVLVIDYEGNIVSYKKDALNTITHAYAISIHKSQGSEFPHVIMPISLNYSRMLYNKLLYTGISRAKKSLILIGSHEAFKKAVHNNYSVIRKTTLKVKILNNIKISG